MKPEENLMNERIRKLNELKDAGINPYAYAYNKNHYAQDIILKYKKIKKNEKTKTKVSVSGRIMSMRVMGKISFGHMQDKTGQIQFYLREDELKTKYKLVKKLDIGDIIGLQGTVFKTKKGELSIWVKDLTLLTKNLRPLPEKWHGLKDKELRYRQRYLDLIVNPEVKEVFEIRRKIIQNIREFLINKGFIEVETPILQPIYGGTNARPFKSHLNELDMAVYMRISNELYLKRLIVGGYEKVFEFSYDFRNEGIDKVHNPEFMQVETMWAYADYTDNMKLVEELFKFLSKKIFKKTKITNMGVKIDLGKWHKVSFSDCLKKYAQVDMDEIKTKEEAEKIAKKLNIGASNIDTISKIFTEIFEKIAQPKLIQPTIVYDFPREAVVLAKANRKDQRFSEAFEIYINGVEAGLSYSEQNDPKELEIHWKKAEEMLKKGDEEAQRLDKDFIRALEYGMPPASGIGIGIDRLAMLFSDSESIRDVIMFPFMKPEN